MSDDLVLSEHRDGLAVLTLNRPDKLNAINGAMIAALDRALDAAESNDSVRAIVVVGAGRAFSAGFDLDMGVEVYAVVVACSRGRGGRDRGRIDRNGRRSSRAYDLGG